MEQACLTSFTVIFRTHILRHAQIDVTMNVYTEVSDAKTIQALSGSAKQLGS